MLNVWDRIADIDGGELPAYAVGNLYVAGAGVARGYWGNDALTAERFPVVDGVRYCNTGDLAYKDETGEVFVLGRLDGMVKLRGFRIELGEVENVLGRHEAVADARAFVREIGGTNHLVVFYTLRKGAEDTDPGKLRSYMAEKLPAYMVPTYFTRLEAFPLTPNGKVSVKELKTLPVDTSSGCDYEPPRNETEAAIKDIISDIIGTDGFGIGDNLFNAGLTSLSVISVLTRINEEYPLAPVSVRDIFAHPTVEAIAEKVSEAPEQERFEAQEDYPLSQTQKGILVECLAAPDSVRYNITWLYRLSEDVDTDRLRKAVEAAILAHPYLSASLFVNEKGEYRVRRSDEARAFVSMRVGNLAARFSDGEFQINYGTNSFMGRLRVYSLLGECPFEQLDEPMEFSPIDEVAKAILLLGQTPRGCLIFHPYDPNTIRSANVFKGMEEMGIAIRPVEKEAFERAIREAEENTAKARLLTSMLAYSNWDSEGYEIPWHNAFTTQVLYRMGYRWPDIGEPYVRSFIGGMIGLGYFDLR